MASLSLAGVSKIFGPIAAVSPLSLDIADGELVCLLGPSGSGKSTLLRMIGGFEMPSSGQVLIDGQDVANTRPNKRPTAMVFQSHALWTHMNVFDNVAFGLKLRKQPARQIRDKVLEALTLVGLEGYDKRMPRQLSGGQQQRVAIARALMQSPKMILADEPIASLDPRNTKVVMDALQRLNRHFGITVLCNLHQVDYAREFADRIIGLAHGRLVFDGTPTSLSDADLQRIYPGQDAEPTTASRSVVLPIHRCAESRG